MWRLYRCSVGIYRSLISKRVNFEKYILLTESFAQLRSLWVKLISEDNLLDSVVSAGLLSGGYQPNANVQETLKLFFKDYNRLHSTGILSDAALSDNVKRDVQSIDMMSVYKRTLDLNKSVTQGQTDVSVLRRYIHRVILAVSALVKRQAAVETLFNAATESNTSLVFENDLCTIYKLDSEEVRGMGASNWCIVQNKAAIQMYGKYKLFFLFDKNIKNRKICLPMYKDNWLTGDDSEISDSAFVDERNSGRPAANVRAMLQQYQISDDEIKRIMQSDFAKHAWDGAVLDRPTDAHSPALVLRLLKGKKFDHIAKEDIKVMNAACHKALLETYNAQVYLMAMQTSEVPDDVKLKVAERWFIEHNGSTEVSAALNSSDFRFNQMVNLSDAAALSCIKGCVEAAGLRSSVHTAYEDAIIIILRFANWMRMDILGLRGNIVLQLLSTEDTIKALQTCTNRETAEYLTTLISDKENQRPTPVWSYAESYIGPLLKTHTDIIEKSLNSELQRPLAHHHLLSIISNISKLIVDSDIRSLKIHDSTVAALIKNSSRNLTNIIPFLVSYKGCAESALVCSLPVVDIESLVFVELQLPGVELSLDDKHAMNRAMMTRYLLEYTKGESKAATEELLKSFITKYTDDLSVMFWFNNYVTYDGHYHSVYYKGCPTIYVPELDGYLEQFADMVINNQNTDNSIVALVHELINKESCMTTPLFYHATTIARTPSSYIRNLPTGFERRIKEPVNPELLEKLVKAIKIYTHS